MRKGKGKPMSQDDRAKDLILYISELSEND